MPATIAEKLHSLGHALPAAPEPAPHYVPFVRLGNLLFISGQISRDGDDTVLTGTLGADLALEDGRKAAEMAAINVLVRIAAATDGRVAAVRRIARLGVFVAATPDFAQHPQVANAASDLILAVFGEAGRHSRVSVGTASLPRGAAVEIDAIVELEEADG